MAYNVLDFPAGSVPVTKETDCDQEELESYPGFETDLQYVYDLDAHDDLIKHQ